MTRKIVTHPNEVASLPSGAGLPFNHLLRTASKHTAEEINPLHGSPYPTSRYRDVYLWIPIRVDHHIHSSPVLQQHSHIRWRNALAERHQFDWRCRLLSAFLLRSLFILLFTGTLPALVDECGPNFSPFRHFGSNVLSQVRGSVFFRSDRPR